MKHMLTLSNTISLLRAPFAFLFLFPSTFLRVFAILAAMISDCVDGYVARRLKSVTLLGKVLDPVMDKFFVYVVIGVLFVEGRLSLFGLFSLLVRDGAVALYVATTLLLYRWKGLLFYPAITSKITTAMQFIVLLCITLGVVLPTTIYHCFFALGAAIYIELLIKTILFNKPISRSL